MADAKGWAGFREMDYDFDVIVAGSGASGGTLAAELASRGASVLLLERGLPCSRDPIHDEKTMLMDKRPYDDRLIEVNSVQRRLYMGGIRGGGTAVYGGALLRPSPEDFNPGRYYGDRIDRSIWDWPIQYSDLEPWYERAERLYGVAADPDARMGPLPRSSVDNRNTPLPLARINRRVIEGNAPAGVVPFRLPLGIESKSCLSCSHCAGFVCPTGARRSADQLVERSRAEGGDVTVREGCEVTRLRRNGRQIAGIEVYNRSQESSETFTARRYVLAAGAIATPGILQRSGYTHDQLGRNYMMHYSPIVAGIFLGRTDAGRTFVKQLGFSDYYFGTDDLPEKMGIVQSLPAPGPLMLQKTGLRLVPKFALNALRDHMLPLVGIVEDLPGHSNRVFTKDNGRITVQHRFSDFDKQRGAALARAMGQILRRAGALNCVSRAIPTSEHVAHQCGTVRFGSDPRHAIVDSECRMFEFPNVFVVDGSVLPTSLGVGPSLTLIANALRIADVIRKDLSHATREFPVTNSL